MKHTLLIISTRKEDRAFAAEVALTAGLTLRTAQTLTEAVEVIVHESPIAIFADVSSHKLYLELEAAIQNSIGLFSDKINANGFHFLSSENLDQVQYLVQSPLFGHFIIRNFWDIKEAGQHYGRIVKATLGHRAFGQHQLLAPDTKIQTVRLKLSTQKQDAVEAVRSFLTAANFQTRMASVIANAVDEILMNAMYDAPVDEFGRPLLASTSRATEVKLEGDHTVEMQIGYDGHYAAVTAVDYFGSLDKAKLLTHISKIYSEEEYRIRSSVAGAGIGLATVFRSGGSLLFISEAGTRTEVTVFFSQADNYRAFKDQFRFLSTQFYF